MIGDNIAIRLRAFAVAAIGCSRTISKNLAATHVARQLVRSASAGGANYEEARGAESRADFIHKIGVANKELREARYWLEVSKDAELLTGGQVEPLVREAGELIAILVASIRTARRGE